MKPPYVKASRFGLLVIAMLGGFDLYRGLIGIKMGRAYPTSKRGAIVQKALMYTKNWKQKGRHPPNTIQTNTQSDHHKPFESNKSAGKPVFSPSIDWRGKSRLVGGEAMDVVRRSHRPQRCTSPKHAKVDAKLGGWSPGWGFRRAWRGTWGRCASSCDGDGDSFVTVIEVEFTTR